MLSGGAGNDTYVFTMGDGFDLIDDQEEAGDVNAVFFGPGIDADSIRLEYAGHGGGLRLNIGSEGLVLMGFNGFEPTASQPIDGFHFADGTTLSLNALLNRGIDVRGTSSTPFGGVEFLSGTFGDDRISGLDGADDLSGGAGNDTLIGGRGNDVLHGGAGQDTYVFHPGDGADEIEDDAEVIPGQTDPQGRPLFLDNRLQFGEGITLADLTFVQLSGLIRKILIGDSGDAVTLPNLAERSHGLNTLVFWDGLTVNAEEAFSAGLITEDQIINAGPDDEILIGGAGNDRIVGAAPAVSMIGGSGSDTLSGGAGVNRFYGGPGSDLLIGGSGSNVFIFSIGNGVDAIRLPPNVPGGNSIDFGGSYDAYNPRLGYGSLVIRYGNQGDAVHVESFDPNDAYRNPGIDRIGFTDRVLSYQELIDLGFDLPGTSGDDVFQGTNVTDRLSGLDGHDTLEGGAGEDTLTGGRGEDLLLGGGGDDSYVFNLGDGLDTIDDEAVAGAGNRLRFGAGITHHSLTLTPSEHTLTIGIGSSGDAIRLEHFDPARVAGSPVVEILEFSDGSQVHLSSLLLGATDGDDVLLGAIGEDVIEGLGGHDVIDGRDGDDTVNGGEGDDILIGGGGHNIMSGGPGHDTFVVAHPGDVVVESAGEGTDTVESVTSYTLPANVETLRLIGPDVIDGAGNALDNMLIGNAKANTLVGGEGDDMLVGIGGNDSLSGGPGSDVLQGGADSDIYAFARGDGQDTIVDHDPTAGTVDTARFSSPITPLDLILSRTGNDLRLALHGSADELSIRDWYGGPADQVEVFHAGNGQRLLNNQVDQLIQAMAGFSAQFGLTWEQGIEQRPEDVQAVLAGSWQ